MTAQDLIAALELPESCRVDQRVPKKMLVEKSVITATNKRYINDGIEEIQWAAAIKSNTTSVADYRDATREYLEIAVLIVKLKSGAKTERLAELVHRAVPYPALIVMTAEKSLTLSMANKRWAQNEADSVVLDGAVEAVEFSGDSLTSKIENQFLKSISLLHQSQAHMYVLYQSWMDVMQALNSARLTGIFRCTETAEQAIERRIAIQEYFSIEREITSLRSKVLKEKQLVRQVEINLKLKRLEIYLLSLKQHI